MRRLIVALGALGALVALNPALVACGGAHAPVANRYPLRRLDDRFGIADQPAWQIEVIWFRRGVAS